MDERDKRAQEWNDALASGDEARIESVGDRMLLAIYKRQLEDWNVQRRTRGENT